MGVRASQAVARIDQFVSDLQTVFHGMSSHSTRVLTLTIECMCALQCLQSLCDHSLLATVQSQVTP